MENFDNVRVWRDVMVVVRDGIRLATDIYFPADSTGPFPVLLERTPYNKRGTNHADRDAADPAPKSKPAVAAEFARAGYAYVLQDCRGRYESEGGFEKYLNEGPDGADTMAWIMQQSWCAGKVGTLGLSYGAHVQTALAAFAPQGLAAMFLDSGGFSSAFHSGIRQGGAFELKQLTWAYKHALLAPETSADPARRKALAAEDLRAWMSVQPWQSGASPLAAAPEYEQYVVEQWSKELFSEYWCAPALFARGHYESFPDVPMVHMSSWFDPYSLTAIENYVGLARGRRGPVRLVLGPWTHGQRSVSHAGEVDFGPEAILDGNIAPDYTTLRRAWFDRYERGIDAPDYLSAPVKLFVMGGGSGRKNAQGRLEHGGGWRDEIDWPPPSAVHVSFHLRSSGLLVETAPIIETGSVGYDFDPRNPVPTIGGAIASGAPIMAAGAFDQREGLGGFGERREGRALADRADVMVFQTEPLLAPVEVTGSVVAHLWVSSTAVDTDFTIKLIDVYPPSADYPEGCSINLAHGILRMRFRESFEHSKLMEPGAVYKIQIPSFPTSNLFETGHRIRLDISSSNFPHFDVNPNTGAPAGHKSEPVVAHNRVHMDTARPSHVILPIVPR